MLLWFGPAVRADRAPSRFDACEPTETRRELVIREPQRRLADNFAISPMVRVALEEMLHQAFVDGPGTEDQKGVARPQPVRDVQDKPLQVFEAVCLAGGLWAPAAVTDCRIMPDVAGGPMVSRYFRLRALDADPRSIRTDDHSLPCVDPHKRARSGDASFDPILGM
ncbi:MAG TPA: hypothetical protein VFY18_11200 [Candidatus Limnocylindrales bacterium]|nr:hypothetical protein [Candidatus Limnocylindrales bacterium]